MFPYVGIYFPFVSEKDLFLMQNKSTYYRCLLLFHLFSIRVPSHKIPEKNK